MTEYDNTNRGSIWKNEDMREGKNDPQFKGSLNVDGVEYWVSAWKRKEGASAKAPALSFSIKPKEEKSISQRAMPKGPATGGRVVSAGGGRPTSIIPDDDMDGDRIPF